jgi:hypothetical protein
MEFAFSDNEETFHGACATLEIALAEALDNYPDDDSIWIGEVTRKTIGGYFGHHDVENLLEQIQETAADQCGEVTEDWLAPLQISGPKIESREERNARYKAAKVKNQERLAPLLDDIRAALEKWATEEDEQPRFYQVGNVKNYTRDEALATLKGFL